MVIREETGMGDSNSHSLHEQHSIIKSVHEVPSKRKEQ